MTSLTLFLLAAGTIGSQPRLLDFYSDHCGPCRQMVPVIAELERRGHAVEKIDVDRQPEMAAKFRVESIPCLVVVLDDREIDRTLGVTPIEKLESMLRTAGTANTVAGAANSVAPPAVPEMQEITPPVRGPRRGPLSGALASAAPGRRAPRGTATRGRQPLGSTGTPRLSASEQIRPQGEPNVPPLELAEGVTKAAAPQPSASAAAPANPLQMSSIQSELPLNGATSGADFAASTAPAPAGDWKPSAAVGAGAPSMPAEMPASAATPDASASQQLLSVSVRLKIEDSTGHSFGSGTIIDIRGEDALVLTCGHVFRDSQGKGAVTVDMFGPAAPQGIPGEVIGYDLESDVGLISFRPGKPVATARVAPPGLRVKAGDPVFNSGCNNGADPTIRSSRVTSIDKYLGPPNLQVAGQPVQGRSGGGLFNARGEVIGVCNAADPTDNEGLYAGLPSVYKLLDNSGLSQVYQPVGAELASTPNRGNNAAPGGRPPHMPEQMPIGTNPPQATETSAPQGHAWENLGSGAEIVCVVRTSSDPSARNEVIVLDRASPEFLRQLAIERDRQKELNSSVPAVDGARTVAPVLQAQAIAPQRSALR